MTVELLIDGAELVVTLDAADRELAGGWVALDGGLVAAVGGPGDERPEAQRVLRADGCLVTPGLINTHHHIYQNLTRAHRPSVNTSLFTWLTTLYPLWAGLDASSLSSQMGQEGLGQLYVRLMTANFEEAVAARKEGRAPVFEDRR